ncbi:hypothetical protein F4859DRAFT_107802 [Xylaria cf. heliscus]|nr:hypothetical protein F4859DRAFT_107802 [Xylaria cf. heliscus]
MSNDNTWKLFNKRYDNSHDTPNVFNNQSTVEGVLITFAIISWTCVCLRIHSRFRLQCLGWDDLFVVIFRVTGTVGTTFLLLLFDNGFGKHFYEIGKANQVAFQKKYYVALLSYTLSTSLMKECLLTQYLRLFCDDPRARRVCWFFIVLSALWGTAFFVIALVPCVPIWGFWDWDSSARCYGFGSKVPNEIGGTYAAHVATNVVLDIIVLAIPIPLYFKTFKQKKQRLGFSIMIFLGIGVNIISIWRLHAILDTRAGTYPVIDPTFYGPQSIVLAALEVDLASIVASIPVFWPMLTQTFGSIFVTQEVHVTHHHRRLSGDDTHHQFELSSRRSSRTRGGSDGSLKLVIMDTDGQSRSSTPNALPLLSLPSVERPNHAYDRNDPYVRGRVYPLEGGLVASDTQVISEGQRGFERNYREHFGALPALDKLDDTRLSSERRSKDDQHDRSWSLATSRKSSQRFA